MRERFQCTKCGFWFTADPDVDPGPEGSPECPECQAGIGLDEDPDPSRGIPDTLEEMRGER